MKTIRNLAVLSAFVALSGTSAWAADTDAGAPRAHRQITKEQAMQRAARRFDEADANHDGTLSDDEMRAARQKQRERKAERQQARDHKQRDRQAN